MSLLTKLDFLHNLWWVLLVFSAGWIGSFMCSLWWFNRQIDKQTKASRSRRANRTPMPRSYIDFEQAARVGFKIKNDTDFEVIEGIGPTTSGVLKKIGYSNLFDLSKANAQDIKRSLEQANANYKWIDTETWPKQAELARTNRWYELKGLQDHLISSTVSETLILNKF